MRFAIAGLFMTAVLVPGQAPSEKKAEFEVASIRLATPDNSHDTHSDRERFQTHNISLKRLVAMAYQIDVGQVYGGPTWVDTDGFDINAKIPDELTQNRTPEQLPEMVRGLLADRFKLVIHREDRSVSGFSLVVTKKGSKMEPAEAGDTNSSMSTNNKHMVARNVTMGALARRLSQETGKLVVDKTELKGGFNFEWEWAPERLGSEPDAGADGRPSIFTALQERLGLKLEAGKVPVAAVVIDRAERPEGN